MVRKMIELYTAATPNGWKATITLEELGLDYQLHPVDLAAGEQRQESFLRLNPNGRIPVIVDHDGPVRRVIFESGAILMYLAEKTHRWARVPVEGLDNLLAWIERIAARPAVQRGLLIPAPAGSAARQVNMGSNMTTL